MKIRPYNPPNVPPPPRQTPMQLALRVALVIALYLAAALTIDENERSRAAERTEPAAICDTDTDCARHCPPPADDPDCDGGPQS